MCDCPTHSTLARVENDLVQSRALLDRLDAADARLAAGLSGLRPTGGAH